MGHFFFFCSKWIFTSSTLFGSTEIFPSFLTFQELFCGPSRLSACKFLFSQATLWMADAVLQFSGCPFSVQKSFLFVCLFGGCCLFGFLPYYVYCSSKLLIFGVSRCFIVSPLTKLLPLIQFGRQCISRLRQAQVRCCRWCHCVTASETR